MTRSRAPQEAPKSRLSASQAPPRPSSTRPDPGTALTEPLSAPLPEWAVITPHQGRYRLRVRTTAPLAQIAADIAAYITALDPRKDHACSR